jgi:membrane protein DedA with SNARE-associated domain
MNIFKFIFYNIIGTAIKSSVFMYIGYLAGAAYIKYAKRIGLVSTFLLITIVVIVIATALIMNKRKKNI